jgi:hypothetical protein
LGFDLQEPNDFAELIRESGARVHDSGVNQALTDARELFRETGAAAQTNYDCRKAIGCRSSTGASPGEVRTLVDLQTASDFAESTPGH